MLIKSYDSYDYVEVFEILEYKDGMIYRTKHKGFAHVDRPKQENEAYSSLSTTLTKQTEFELELLP